MTETRPILVVVNLVVIGNTFWSLSLQQLKIFGCHSWGSKKLSVANLIGD
jgi:hypothetical protein